MALFYSLEDDLARQAGQYWGWHDRTKLVFGANRPSTLISGCDWEIDLTYNGITRTLCYARVPITNLVSAVNVRYASLKLYVALSGQALITELRNQLGLPVELADFDNPSLTLMTGIQTLTISSTSRAFTGVLTISTRIVSKPITTIPTNKYSYNLRPSFWYSEYEYEDTIAGYTWTAKFNPGLFTYGLDYTSQADVLKTFTAYPPPWASGNVLTNSTLLTNLANALKAVDAIPWVTGSGRADYSLYNGWIYYNGPVAGVDPTILNTMGDPHIHATKYQALAKLQGVPNLEYDNVMLIQICTPYNGGVGYQFALMIHYNNWS